MDRAIYSRSWKTGLEPITVGDWYSESKTDLGVHDVSAHYQYASCDGKTGLFYKWLEISNRPVISILTGHNFNYVQMYRT